MGETRGVRRGLSCLPRFTVEQRDSTLTGGRQSERWVGAECREDPPRGWTWETGPCGTWGGEGPTGRGGRKRHLGHQVMGPQVPTWVQRASAVGAGTVQCEMSPPCFRVSCLSTRLQLLEVVLVETVSFQPHLRKLCGKEGQTGSSQRPVSGPRERGLGVSDVPRLIPWGMNMTPCLWSLT